MKKTLLTLLIFCLSLAAMAQQKDTSAKDVIKKAEAAEEIFRNEIKKSELKKPPVILHEKAAVKSETKATKRKHCKKKQSKKDS